MKSIKLAVLSLSVLATTGAMANVVADTGAVIADGVTTVGTTVVDSGKTVFKTLAKPAAVNAEIGTLGYGASIAWSANPTTEVVAGWNGGRFDTDVNIGGNDSVINWKKVLGSEYADYKGKLKIDAKLSNPYVGVNVRPWANQFTVGTGVIFQDNKISGTLTPAEGTTSTVSVDGVTHEVAGAINAKIEPRNTLAPYLTVGVKPNTNSASRVGFFGEVGAAYSGKWDAAVNIDGDVVSLNKTKAELESDLAKKLRSDSLNWYPIVKVGATVRF